MGSGGDESSERWNFVFVVENGVVEFFYFRMRKSEPDGISVIYGENRGYERKYIRGVTRDASDVLSYMIVDYAIQSFSSLQNIR